MIFYIVIFATITTPCFGQYYLHRINHMEFYKNRTRPAKAFSFSSNYFNQNSLGTSGKGDRERVQCGTRTVEFNPGRKPKIVGGTEAPYGAYPWQVEIQMFNADKSQFEHHCGGSIIGEKLILSAAHCFDKQPLHLEHIRVVTGEHRLNMQDKHENQFLVEKVVTHPDFRKNGPHSNDIALVVISPSGSGVKYNSHVRPICLPDSEADDGQWCAVTGWGYQTEELENFAPALRAAAVPVLDLGTCRKNQILGGRQQAILDSMICAGMLTGGVDACRGDSGGPLVCSRPETKRWSLHGVVSWGTGCGRRARPGVYTRVRHFVPWVTETAAKLGYKLPKI